MRLDFVSGRRCSAPTGGHRFAHPDLGFPPDLTHNGRLAADGSCKPDGIMRLLFKIGLLLLALSYFVPLPPQGSQADDPALSPLVLLYGAQQAITDVGGFCTRAPAACASARDALGFAVDRIGDGAAFLAGQATGAGRMPGPTGAVPDETQPAPPRAYTPPTSGISPGPALHPVAASTGAPSRPPAPTAGPGPAPYIPPTARTDASRSPEREPEHLPLPRSAPPRA